MRQAWGQYGSGRASQSTVLRAAGAAWPGYLSGVHMLARPPGSRHSGRGPATRVLNWPRGLQLEDQQCGGHLSPGPLEGAGAVCRGEKEGQPQGGRGAGHRAGDSAVWWAWPYPAAFFSYGRYNEVHRPHHLTRVHVLSLSGGWASKGSGGGMVAPLRLQGRVCSGLSRRRAVCPRSWSFFALGRHHPLLCLLSLCALLSLCPNFSFYEDSSHTGLGPPLKTWS